MATVIVSRQPGVDQHGDPTGAVTTHTEDGAKVAWGQASEDTIRKSVVITPPTVYFRRIPDIRRRDDLITPNGRKLRVIDVQEWEHFRHDHVVGVVVICEEVA